MSVMHRSFLIKHFNCLCRALPLSKMLLAIALSVVICCCQPASAQTAPIANAGADQSVLDRENDGVEDVILDASASTDADGTIVSYVWSEGQTQLSNDFLMRTTLTVGTHNITLTVTDDDNLTHSDTVTVTVTGVTGPLQRRNLKTTTTRFTRPLDLVWPANVGDADICLWKDDKFAAMSITIDDNIAPDHDWWCDISDDTGWKFTWFIIINSLSEYSGNSYFGSWPEFDALYALGHDVQSHTVHHHSDDNTRPEYEVIPEYRDSKAMIESNISGNQVLTYAWPYGASNRDIAAIYACAGRGTTGTPNKPERTNYLNTGSSSGRIDAAYLDSVLYGTSSISWLGNDAYKRGWLCSHFHLVQDKTALQSDIDYAYARRDSLWVGLFNDVARYGQERDTATLTVTNNTASQIAMTLSDEMDDTLYDFPLTIKVKLYASWNDIDVTQGGSAIDYTIVTHNSEDYALIQAVPDSGTIVITPTGLSNYPPVADAGSDQTLTDNDDNSSESVTLDASGSYDSDGSIVSYVWTENAQQIATGVSPTLTLAVGTHDITLTVTDDDSDTATDTITVTVDPAPSAGRTLYLYSRSSDGGLYSTGSKPWYGDAWARVGGATTNDGCFVMVFELPELTAGESITAAYLDVYLSSYGNTPHDNVDLYGLTYRSIDTVIADDFYQGVYDGDTTDATALQSALVTASSAVGWHTATASGQTALASYIEAQYAAGAVAGDFVFLRLNADTDQSDYRYWVFATGNATEKPMLTLETTTNIAPTADAGADQNVTDTDNSGSESVTLDASGSSDSDGSIVSYVWTENAQQIATGVSPAVSLAVGTHNITLTVTDDLGATDTDTVSVTVAAAPTTREVTLYSLGSDGCIYSNGSRPWSGDAWARVGGATTVDGCFIMVFELPALAAGEYITGASLDVHLNSIANHPHDNVDLYGLGYRSSYDVLSSDFYQGTYDGDTTDATALQSAFVTDSSAVGWHSTTAGGEANLADYVDNQYTTGGVGGDYIFLRLNADTDQANYYYWVFATGNSSTDDPTLTLTIAQ